MQEGSVEEARKELSQALLDDDPALQTASLHALGNIAVAATLDDLRRLYHAPTEAPSPDDTGEDEAPPARPAQVTPQALQKIVDALRTDIRSYQDALAINPNFAPARQNIEKINELIKKLEEEIERLRQQQQQDNQQQDDQQQDDQQQDDQQQDDRQQGDRQQGDRQQGDRPQEVQQQPASPLSEKEKSQQRAAGILRMHLDEEKGSPIPHRGNVPTPEKDY